jgi:hypothetical protein
MADIFVLHGEDLNTRLDWIAGFSVKPDPTINPEPGVKGIATCEEKVGAGLFGLVRQNVQVTNRSDDAAGSRINEETIPRSDPVSVFATGEPNVDVWRINKRRRDARSREERDEVGG